MSEVRFAILIGINDYTGKPLSFCVKDTNLLKQRLITNCQYESENIFEIISELDRPMTGAYDRLVNIVEDIQNRFVTGQDQLLFYFSGHGRFLEETVLEFHERTIPVQEIYHLLNKVNPSNLIFILDACHSGFGLEVKDSINAQVMTSYYNQRYVAKAKGFYFLCSCKQDETSKSFAKYDSSIYTKFFCDALDNSSIYDTETLSLTLSGIHEYVAKKITLNGDYQQTPFFQTVGHGFYPFSYLSSVPQISRCGISLDKSSNPEEIHNFLSDPQLNMPENFRRDLAQFFAELIPNLFQHNHASHLSIIIAGNTIEINDHSPFNFNPFEAQVKEDCQGIKVYKTFLQKYREVVETSYLHGNPNVIKLEFSDQIFTQANSNPCYFETSVFNLLVPNEFNNYDFDLPCDEIILDISKSTVVLSGFHGIFEYLLKRTERKKQLLILRMHKEDMIKDLAKDILTLKYGNDRIMII